jgi:hypothetical protein
MLPGGSSRYIRSAIGARFTNNARGKNLAFELDFPKIGTYVVSEVIEWFEWASDNAKRRETKNPASYRQVRRYQRPFFMADVPIYFL